MQLPGIENPSLGTCKRHGARYTCVFHDALSFPEAGTTASQGGQGDNEVMPPLGSALGSPQIAAGWGGQLDERASSCSNVEQSLEWRTAGASGIEEAASSAGAESVADVSSTADGGDGGVKDGWEEVKGTTSKAKTKVLPIKLKGSRSNAGRSSTWEKSRLGNPNNVVEAPRPRGNAGLHGNGGESKRGNPNNVPEVLRPRAR